MVDMTGRDLILYILSNGLENEPVYQNGTLLGFLTEIEAASTFGVGPATIQMWVERGQLDAIKIGDSWYIPKNQQNPLERTINEKNKTNTFTQGTNRAIKSGDSSKFNSGSNVYNSGTYQHVKRHNPDIH